VARPLRTEIRVTAIAIPSSRMIRPTSCAPNSELVSESGMVEGAATGSGLAGVGLATFPGAGLGAEDGLIRGNRLDALPAGMVIELPAGMVVEVPATPTSGIDPRGRLAPRL